MWVHREAHGIDPGQDGPRLPAVTVAGCQADHVVAGRGKESRHHRRSFARPRTAARLWVRFPAVWAAAVAMSRREAGSRLGSAKVLTSWHVPGAQAAGLGSAAH